MKRQSTSIQSVFSKWLGRAAREMAAEGRLAIIEVGDFPEGAPLHEDGSTEYDPMKPLVLFAVLLRNASEVAAWASVCREYDALVQP